MTDIIAQVDDLIQQLDRSLGRPPFPNPSNTDTLQIAENLRTVLTKVKDSHKVQLLKQVEAATTTFPILCAALPDGSPNGTPCLQLYRSMLGSLAILSRVVTYPISNIIKSAAAILGDNDMVLFTLYYESGALTTELFSDMLGIPRTPAVDNKPSGKKSKKKQVPTPAHNGGAVVANKLTPALLSTVLKWNLSSECQAVLLRCIGDTDRFLALVGSDGTLAAEVLNIYAPALTPSLKLVSLVPALNDYLLDFFIDLAQVHAGGQVAALHEVTFVDVALSQWDEARLACICKEMEVRCPAPSDAMGSIMVDSFLLHVLQEKHLSFERSQVYFEQLWVSVCRAAEKLLDGSPRVTVTLDEFDFPRMVGVAPLVAEVLRWCVQFSVTQCHTYKCHRASVADSLADYLSTLACSFHVCNENLSETCCSNLPKRAKGKASGKKKGASEEPSYAEREARPLADYVAQLSSLYALIDCLSFREESSIQGLREVSRLIVAFVQYKKIQLHSSVTTAYVDHVYLFLHQSYTNNGVDGLRASMEFINTTPVVANTLTQIVKQTFFIWWLTPLVRSDTEELRFHWDADLRRAALDEICFSTGPQNNSLWEAPSVDRSALLVAVVSTMTDADLHEYLRALEPSRRQSLLAKLEKYIAEAEKNVSVLEAMKEFLETLQEDDSKTQQEREEELAQRTREKADALLKEQERLLQEKRVFDKKNEKRQQRQMAEQELVRKERARRLEEKNKIREEEQKQTEMKRAIALRAGTAKSMQSKEEQRREQKERLDQYKSRMLNDFRVTQFMEGLGFASSTILRVKTDLGPALSTISPDDLLEFLVTGEKTVPVDMITDDDSEEVVADTRDTGDFWSDVMGSGPNRVVQEKKRSFHFRVAPFLDLFCYAGGDEYGSLPTVLPYLRLSIVKCIIASADVASLGFKGVEDAFATMKAHGIVTLHNDLAQLTALGFRYHFPFHNEENMLEVQIRRNASAVKDLLARRKAEGEARAVEYEEGELHLHNDSEDEDDEEEESEYSSDDQVLPELKFGI